jgi:hypothetical protein
VIGDTSIGETEEPAEEKKSSSANKPGFDGERLLYLICFRLIDIL